VRAAKIMTTIVHSVDDVIRTCRIVVGGLMAGLLLFAGVALSVAPLTPSPDPQITAVMVVMLLVTAVGCGAGYWAVRRAVTTEMGARLADSPAGADTVPLVVDGYRRLVVIRGGLIEAPGFLALTVYIVTGHVLALGAAGVAVLLLGLHLPSSEEMRRLASSAAPPAP
jgi:hypothetical protein